MKKGRRALTVLHQHETDNRSRAKNDRLLISAAQIV